MSIYYRNSEGKKIYLDRVPYKMLTDTDLFDYEWSYDTKNEVNPVITGFYRNMVKKKLSIAVTNDANYEQAAASLLEAVEKDIVNLAPGRLYVNNSYISCYITKSEKENWKRNAKVLLVTFTLVTEKGSWITETKSLFRPELSSGDDGLNYPFQYPFNFAGSTVGRKMNNESYAASDFEMILYGSCLNPTVAIGGHIYGVDCSLETGEYLVVNSISKKIYKVKTNGETVNQFNLRNRDSYIFKKIPSGNCAVTWSGLFGFDVTLLSERSELIWI